ncbi:MAG: ABC transporter substrate-binding protein [Candidatus Aminicenantes bacterium]|nr:ABC transporter substrate-binding protein [Candidatus Aminicenantes bacterium]
MKLLGRTPEYYKLIFRNTKIFLLITLCSRLAFSQTVFLTDGFGHRFELKSCPQRIVSLAPNLTEILFALGLNEQVIGVTRFCDFPPEARSRTVVGGLVDFNLEIIHSLQPDLVLGFRGNPKTLLERMYDFSLPLFVFEQGKTFEDLFRLIKKIGYLTCRPKAADDLVSQLSRELSEIERAVARYSSGKKVFLMLSGQGSALWTCGRDSYMNHLLDRAGVKNIMADVPGNWLAVNQEQIIAADPEIVLILSQDKKVFEQARQFIIERKALSNIKAIKSNNIFFLDEDIFSRFGPRLIQAFRNLVGTLYPEISNTCGQG